jgi:hypothetical protein
VRNNEGTVTFTFNRDGRVQYQEECYDEMYAINSAEE